MLEDFSSDTAEEYNEKEDRRASAPRTSQRQRSDNKPNKRAESNYHNKQRNTQRRDEPQARQRSQQSKGKTQQIQRREHQAHPAVTTEEIEITSDPQVFGLIATNGQNNVDDTVPTKIKIYISMGHFWAP